ncbi:cupin domain-containing protein [Natrialba sp. PRR66]|uniref:cupin domain-containing protein n=1 Tax=Natrialba sp. PRR66 TaxID=3098146 RepID=UPI002B1DD3FE|nr:cupin domain-containing protein [Natrialba sp. PRR66]
MVDDWEHTSLNDLETNPEKPGRRWEVSPALGIDEFNFNVAVLEREESLSQNHFHYHENQKELFYVVSGACRVETREEGFTATEDEFIVFRDGPAGAHLVYNPFDEPCKLVAIGWPQDGRYPVRQLETAADVIDATEAERD